MNTINNTKQPTDLCLNHKNHLHDLIFSPQCAESYNSLRVHGLVRRFPLATSCGKRCGWVCRLDHIHSTSSTLSSSSNWCNATSGPMCVPAHPFSGTCLTFFMCTLHQDSSAHPLDSRTLCIPSMKTKTSGHRSFSYAAPSVWNSLPCEIRHIQSTTAFETTLKMSLFKSYPC